MLKIEVDQGQCNLSMEGNVIQLPMDLGYAIHGIYNTVLRADESGAGVFKDLVQAVVKDGSPVWMRETEDEVADE